jgi:hypothetical protein
VPGQRQAGSDHGSSGVHIWDHWKNGNKIILDMGGCIYIYINMCIPVVIIIIDLYIYIHINYIKYI